MNASNAMKTIFPGEDASPFQQAEKEFAKDVWDVRAIPGAHYMEYSSNHLLNFTSIPLPFRPIVKQYLRFLLSSDLGQSAARGPYVG